MAIFAVVNSLEIYYMVYFSFGKTNPGEIKNKKKTERAIE